MLMQTVFGSIGVKYISVAYRNYIFGNVPNFVEVGLFGTSYDFPNKIQRLLLSVTFCFGVCKNYR